MSKFLITLKTEETVPRAELTETLKALIKEMKSPALEVVAFQLIGKTKNGKVPVNIIELPLSPLRKKV